MSDVINLPTIVTAFYNINNAQRKTHTYLELSSNFILKLPYNLIIFTDDDEVCDFVNTTRANNNATHITHIYKLPFEDTYFYKYMDKIEYLQSQFTIVNGHLDHETPLYITLNNNKFDFIDRSILLNPFKSSHFIWLDFGINHVAKNTDKIHEWILNIPDKIKQLCINPFLEPGEYKEIFKYIYHHTAGGLFSGSIHNLQKYSYLYKSMIDKIFADNWYQIDEAVMTIIQRENPDLFNLYYGDYQGIISNYLEPVNNIDLIFVMLNKAYRFNNMGLMYQICRYLIPYFKRDIQSSSQPTNYFYDFIKGHIICNYYCNGKLLLTDVIFLINRQIVEKDDKMIKLIAANRDNINCYLNANLIINI